MFYVMLFIQPYLFSINDNEIIVLFHNFHFTVSCACHLVFMFWIKKLTKQIKWCLYSAQNPNRSKRSETEINGSALSFLKEGA